MCSCTVNCVCLFVCVCVKAGSQYTLERAQRNLPALRPEVHTK